MRIKIIIILLVLSIVPMLFGQARNSGEKQISYSVPFAPWQFLIESEGFAIEKQQVKQDGKYAYYLMSNQKSGLIVSLYIEPIDKCKSSKECSDMIWKLGNPGWVNPQNIVHSEIAGVSVLEFLIPSFQGQPVRQQNLYAQFVKDGFWIDLHVSKSLFQQKDLAIIRKVVETASFKTKTEKPIDDATRVLEAWRSLWDEGKFQAAYFELSAKTTKSIDLKTWSIYYAGARKPLGNVKSRSLHLSMYINSLEGFPENEGWVFQYKSEYENGKMVLETFAMIRETDGTWKMLNYINNP